MKSKKCSDLIANRIKKETDVVFGVTGGCVVNLVDSFHKAGIKIVPMHHEQSAAIAADAYARFKGFGVCFGTSGPGTTNLTTGVACSYYDSVPVLVIGGQVNSKHLNGGVTGKDRQMGFQEVDGVSLMAPITKYSSRMVSMRDLEISISEAKIGRQGPVFLEICDDLQRVNLPEVSEIKIGGKVNDLSIPELVSSKRPVIILGRGFSGSISTQIPVIGTWGVKERGFDLPDFGITGNPNVNKFLMKADCIIMIGTRMDTHQVPNWEEFCPNAKKIAIGFDFPHKVDRKFNIDLRNSIMKINKKVSFHWIDEYFSIKKEKNNTRPYKFIEKLNKLSSENDIIIPDMGQIGCITFQTWKLKKGQKLFNGINHSPMGYSLPGSIGASLATGKRVIVIIGDGSFMMNMHDLQTIKDLNLDIKIIVANNGGYGMIRQTQNDWKEFLDQGVACNFKIPDLKKLANSFGIKYMDYEKAMKFKGPTISEIKFKDMRISPKWKWGTKLYS